MHQPPRLLGFLDGNPIEIQRLTIGHVHTDKATWEPLTDRSGRYYLGRETGTRTYVIDHAAPYELTFQEALAHWKTELEKNGHVWIGQVP